MALATIETFRTEEGGTVCFGRDLDGNVYVFENGEVLTATKIQNFEVEAAALVAINAYIKKQNDLMCVMSDDVAVEVK